MSFNLQNEAKGGLRGQLDDEAEVEEIEEKVRDNPATQTGHPLSL